jgi:ribosomal protein S3
LSRPDFISLCSDKGTKKFAVSPPEAVSAIKTKKTRKEKLYCKVNLKHSSPQGPVNNRDLKEGMSFLYNEYTKNNFGRFLTTGGIKEIKRHFPASVKEWNNSVFAYISKKTRAFTTFAHIAYTAVTLHPYCITGLAKINSIKGGMNTGRQMSTWARPQLDLVRKDLKSMLQRGIHTAPPVKNNSPAIEDKRVVPIIKHFPASTLEWANSVYAFNTKKTILFPTIDKIVIKLIKSYFNAYFLSSRPKISKLSVLKRMNISKLEFKHTHSKVVIVVYVYCAELKNLEFVYKNLSDLLAKYYNKKVELRVIRLREMQLNAKILAERLAIELNQRIRSPLRTIRNALKTVRTSKVNIKLYYLKKTSSFIKKYYALYNNISTLNVGDLKKIKKTVRNEVIMSTKYKAITGLKIQIAGRLTRRATAAKAVFKGGQVGGLRNFDSSVLGFSVGLLRGHQKPNVQKSYCNSTTKNGAFNVRVCTSSFYSTLAPRTKREIEINQLNLYTWFVTGFSDGEGCFYVDVRENDKYKSGTGVRCGFIISLHVKDRAARRPRQRCILGLRPGRFTKISSKIFWRREYYKTW